MLFEDRIVSYKIYENYIFLSSNTRNLIIYCRGEYNNNVKFLTKPDIINIMGHCINNIEIMPSKLVMENGQKQIKNTEIRITLDSGEINSSIHVENINYFSHNNSAALVDWVIS